MKELLNKLPQSWNDITLADFQKLVECKIIDDDVFGGVENALQVISLFTGLSIDELEQMPMQDLTLLANRIEFITTPPNFDVTTPSILQFKDIKEITFNNYINIIRLTEENLYKNLHKIVKQLIKNDLTEDDIKTLPIIEVMGGFFLFTKRLNKLVKASIKLAKWQYLKQVVKETLNKLMMKAKNLFMKLMAGSFWRKK